MMSCCGDERERKFHCDDNYGSFFGPSRYVIAPRAIQESTSLLLSQNQQHLAPKLSDSNSTAAKTKRRVATAINMKLKLQKIKDSRDYSFLFSDDSELPAPAKEPPPSSDPRPMSEQPSSGIFGTLVNGGSVGGRLPPKAAEPSNKLASIMASAHSRKQLIKKKTPFSKDHSSVKQRKDNREEKPKMPVASSSIPQKSKPPTHQRPKKPVRRLIHEDDDEGQRAISMIRGMFHYNPNKYADDDEDDINMEAGFDDIQKEERRTSRIAKNEDEEQLRLIEGRNEESVKDELPS